MLSELDFDKMGGVVIAVVQHYQTMQVLMVGVMNKEAVDMTLKNQRVTFWSRTKGRLWTKGESSGNYLVVKQILVDCDQDTVLVLVNPVGPVCHTGTTSCFEEASGSSRSLQGASHG